MATYDEMARDVSNWANRDTGVLDYDRIKQCLVFAHDEIYRTLRIASMEGRFDYDPITEDQVESGALQIPSNTVEFIQLRKKFDGRGANSAAANRFTVAEARNDIRSFYGNATSRYSNFSYSREHDRLLVYPGLTESEEWQLYYYYRFEDPFERVDLLPSNVALLEYFTDDELISLKEADSSIIDAVYKSFNEYYLGFEIGDLIGYQDGLYEVNTAVTPVSNWSGDISYMANSIVLFENVVYTNAAAITAPSDPEVPNVNPEGNTDWTEVTDNPTEIPNLVWDPRAEYEETDVVSYDNGNGALSYEAVNAIPAPAGSDSDNLSPENNTDWTEITSPMYTRWGDSDISTENVGRIVGVLEDNWFRDENEKALLFGALHQAFDYLDEQDQSGKFKAKFEQELQKLNDEERRRQVLGGNVQTNFYSVLI